MTHAELKVKLEGLQMDEPTTQPVAVVVPVRFEECVYTREWRPICIFCGQPGADMQAKGNGAPYIFAHRQCAERARGQG